MMNTKKERIAMHLKELIEVYSLQEKVKIVEDGKILYEGEAEALYQLLNAHVRSKCSRSEDGVTVVEVYS